MIGHRGASGYRPEHTLASYELAARRTTKIIDGVSITGWFTEDLTLAELRTLRAVERLPSVRQRNTLYNGLFTVPTFQEVLDLRERLSRELRRTVGVYPETKHPTYFRSIGLGLEEPLVRALRRNHLDRPKAPVFVQSFELANLRDLRQRHRLTVPLVFLTGASGGPFGDPRTYAEYLTPAGLAELRSVVSGIGPEKGQIIPRTADGTLGSPTSLVADAHHAGLVVHPYTFRAENQFLPVDYRTGTDPTAYGRAIDEQTTFLATGIDGLFTDQADIGVLSRERFLAS